MPQESLYNLNPLAVLMGLGMLIALVPLLWVLWRNRHAHPMARHRALALLVLFLTFDLVLFGAFTRLSDSGLGCPDWPGCYGNASPLGAVRQIELAQQALPSGPVTHGKAWVEMVHRYLASGVGVLIIVLALSAWRAGSSTRTGLGDSTSITSGITPGITSSAGRLRTVALLTLVWVCVQGAFGALTVTMKLFPAIVTLHLLGAMLLLVLLVLQMRMAGRLTPQTVNLAKMPDPAMPPAVQGLAWLTMAMLALQIGLGGWVSTNYAVLACQDFPACQGSAWPAMNFAQGFELWRPLGQTGQGAAISFQALTAIHYTHRLMAVVVLALLLLLSWQLGRRLKAEGAAPSGATRALAALALLQLATGLGNVVLGWPLLAALLHTGGAAALVVVMTWILHSFYDAPSPETLSEMNATDAKNDHFAMNVMTLNLNSGNGAKVSK